MKTRATRDEQREDTRKRLYDAALEAFRRDGAANARIDDIVEKVGVARGTFYFHFPSRDDVLRDLLAEAQRDLAARLDALPKKVSVDRVLSTTATAMAERWQNDPKLLADVASVAIRVPAGGLSAMARDYPALDSLGRRLREAADRGELAAELPPELLASFFLTNLFAASVVWTASPGFPLEQMLLPVVRFFKRAVSPAP